MTSDPRMCGVHAVAAAGTAIATVKGVSIAFDATSGQSETLPGPADLLAAAFAACVLKNVERFSGLLPFRYERAEIDVSARRQDSPPRMVSVHYTLRIVTDEPAHRLELLHTNLRRHGTIYNTIAATCEVTGEVLAEAAGSDRDGVSTTVAVR